MRHGSGASLERLLRRTRSLRRLSTNYPSPNLMLTVRVVSQLPKQLTHIDLRSFEINPKIMRSLGTRCSQLEEVRLPHTCTDGCVAALLRHLPALRRLEAVNSEVRGTAFSLLPASLESLNVDGCEELQSACLRQLTRCPGLRQLDVSGVEGLRSADLAVVLDSCPQLEELDVAWCEGLKSTCLRQLTRCPQLRELSVLFLSELDAEDLAAGLAGCPQLERLSVAGCEDLSSTCLRQLVRCPKLRKLDVTRMKSLQAADLAAVLAGCRQLEWLSAVVLQPPLELCLPPAGLPSLRYLDVSRSHAVTDAALQELPDLLPGLHTLKLELCGRVTEDGLRCLSRLKELRMLDLSQLESATDAVLDELHSPRLRELNLFCCRSCSAAGVARLVLGCPSLTLLGWRVNDVTRTRSLINRLTRQLTLDRDVTLEVWDLKDVRRPRSGPLRLR
ncbi:F-box/LRR-repeat protein 2-like [Pollicipes pollicipes]|uniref:F-box/LRR-repeat protein 2-like n=1 Tax=Pollicipes pollicipes TaxID=41117 RepID=UPI0018854A18|nr:F-box/LRR-repeat protein 2-like [Pollicipes pollicipes]